MTSAIQASGIMNVQPTTDLNWADKYFSYYVNLDEDLHDLTPKLGSQTACLPIELGGGETKDPPNDDTQPARGVSSDLTGTRGSTLVDSTAEEHSVPSIQACSQDASETRGETGSEAVHKSELIIVEQEEIENQVLDLRHKLQRGLLTKDRQPREEDMPIMASTFSELEDLGDLSIRAIFNKKVPKALKAIMRLGEIPKEAELHLKERAATLLEKWNGTLDTQEHATISSTAQQPSTIDQEPQVIALTGSHQLFTGAEPSRQPTRNDDELGAIQDVQKVQRRPKRKRSQGTGQKRVLSADSSETVAVVDKPPTPRRPKRTRTSFPKYVNNDNLWLSGSLELINDLLKRNTEERAELDNFKEYILNWGAEDLKVTKEWERSN